jgi:hypothetical protein
MSISLLLVLIVGFVVLIAILGALMLIGLVVYRSRKNQIGKSSNLTQELNPEQAVEITSTSNLLNH